jgi:hypothetical protein
MLHGDQITAVDAHHIENPGEQGESDQPGDQGRHHEVTHRVQRHDGECVDLLGNPHDAELGRERRPRAPGHHERGQHRAELANQGDRHQRSDKGLRANPLQHEHALEPEDHAGERTGEEDDRHRAKPHEPDPLERLPYLERRNHRPAKGLGEKDAESPQGRQGLETKPPETLDGVEDE